MASNNDNRVPQGAVARVVGAYAAAPGLRGERESFFARLAADPRCDGLEIPYGSAGYRQDEQWLWDALPAGGRHVLTLVAATMERLAGDPGFGLASAEPAGRRAAVGLAAEARGAVERLAAAGHEIVAVELQSAPTTRAGAVAEGRDALAASLAELAGWDWAGAALCVEHCDAARTDGRHAKGFLPLTAELAAIAQVAREAATPLGCSLNWGRSAIEFRDAAGLTEHLRQANASGLLRGVMFSGAHVAANSYGPPWQDAHAALAGTVPEPGLLLTAARVAEARVRAGGGLWFDGVKVAVRPDDASVDARLAVVGAVLDALAV